MTVTFEREEDLSIVLCGEAGGGIQTTEILLSRIFRKDGLHVFSTKEYMSRIRGGSNSTQIRIASKPVAAPLSRIDLLVPFDRKGFIHLEKRVGSGTLILIDRKEIPEGLKDGSLLVADVPFSDIAASSGGKTFANVGAVGLLTALVGVARDVVDREILLFFAKRGEGVAEKNRDAAARGYDAGLRMARPDGVRIDIRRDPAAVRDILLTGGDAVGLGAIAGGCNFISSYPMSPSTSVLLFLAGQAAAFGMVAEQAEDEISAVNMAIGAWYAGARAMVTTSGGGFALMEEGVSLAGMLESPLVVHLAQRPGPATGLPTRTEQGDLQMALHAGHGEFPRVLYAPGTIEEAVRLTQRAFNVADRFQIPVFILTDQYLIDSFAQTPTLDSDALGVEKCIVRTDRNYRRYLLTEDGISPRGIPGWGDGLVCLDSDEHDEDGHITEDLDLRVRMVDKRLKKIEALKREAVAPVWTGSADGRVLVVGWGSTAPIIGEAIAAIGRRDIAQLHFPQVYPMGPDVAGLLKRAETLIAVEGNATAQFARILRAETGVEIRHRILKYNGLPFTVEELATRIEATLKGEER